MTLPRYFAILSAACILIFTGVGCSTVASRIKENPQVFQKLSPDDQVLVQNGEIAKGFSKDAVYLAWGKADLIQDGKVDGQPGELWVYFGHVTQTVFYDSVVPRAVGPHCFVPEVVSTPVMVTHPYVRRGVSFLNGKVVSWTPQNFR